MTTATIDISKVLTLITPAGNNFKVSNHKLTDFESIIGKFSKIHFKGVTSITKFEKYNNKLISKGFKKVKTNYSYKNDPVEGAINFSFDYSK